MTFEITSSNWMAGIPDRTRLFDLYIPGSHDTATGYFDRRSGYSSDINTQPAQGVMTNDKRASYRTQLENGIRYFDLRFRKEGNGANQYQLYHTYFLQTNLGEAVAETKAFLEKNPSETVFLSLQPDDASVVTPQDIRQIFNEYKTNNSLPDANKIYADTGIKVDAAPNNLWVEGHKDFETIRRLRPYRGLGKLGPKFDLTTNYSANTPIQDPRAKGTTGNPLNPKLDYSGLALGDVRGKIILVESLFTGYSGNGWSDAGTNVDPLDVQGIFSTGTQEQNNYAAPGYQEKKDHIRDFAKKGNYSLNFGYDRSLPLNYTSASATGWTYVPANMPSSFALTINSGSSENRYKSDGTDTIANMLNRQRFDTQADEGTLTKYNISQKLNLSGPGLKGVMLGDFYTTSQAWYQEFWNGFWYGRTGSRPNVNSNDYPPSDWLTQKIWRQSAIMTPQLSVPANARDALTGLPIVKEGQSVSLKWLNYLGPNTINWQTPQISSGTETWNLNYKVTQVSFDELGLGQTSNRDLGLRSQTAIETANKPRFYFNQVGNSKQSGFGYEGGVETFSIISNPNQDGDRFFRIDLIADRGRDGIGWQAIGVPTYFMVTDA